MKEKILIALGGNALLRAGEKGTAEEQIAHTKNTAISCAKLIEEGYLLALTHGNGPQIGNILRKNEIASKDFPEMPMDICGAQTQGMIGYMLQRNLFNQLAAKKIKRSVVTILTQALVDSKDPAFKNPTKPIGRFFTKEMSDSLIEKKGWTMVEQIGKGFRRVVPSPTPIDIIEGAAIKKAFDDGTIVIACGGGGIPVIKEENGDLKGIEAVIDKDLTGALLANVIDATTFVILTDVEKVSINYKKPDQKDLDKLSIKQAHMYLEEGEFAKGSMGPKVEAACKFLEQGGKKAIITSLEKCLDAIQGKTGTHIEME
jgi:carbamate kinase